MAQQTTAHSRGRGNAAIVAPPPACRTSARFRHDGGSAGPRPSPTPRGDSAMNLCTRARWPSLADPGLGCRDGRPDPGAGRRPATGALGGLRPQGQVARQPREVRRLVREVPHRAPGDRHVRRRGDRRRRGRAGPATASSTSPCTSSSRTRGCSTPTSRASGTTEFVAENKDKFAKVRVFDSYLPVGKPKG